MIKGAHNSNPEQASHLRLEARKSGKTILLLNTSPEPAVTPGGKKFKMTSVLTG